MKCHSIGQTVQYYMPSRRSRDLTHLSGRYQYGEWGLIPHSPKRVLMRCKFRAVTSHWRQFFSCEMKLWWILRALVTDQSKYEKNQRSGRLESNAVQSSRSKSSPRTGHVLRFQWNSVVTSDGGAPCTKAWKQCLAWFWIDHYQRLKPNQSQMKCDVWMPSRNLHWLDELRISIWRFFKQKVGPRATVQVH